MAFLALLAAVLISAPGIHVVGQQPGFLSIDCGLEDKYSGYKDPNYGILYVSDGTYTDAGENLKVAHLYESWQRPYQTVRSFPSASGVRNCYALPTEADTKYLVRLAASYGDHDSRNDSSSMEFDVHLGANYWDTVYVASDQVYEVLFVAWASWAPVCLFNTGHGAPFLSLLELRQLGSAMYPPLMANQTMSMFRRRNMGGGFTRFPEDKYDRYWWDTVGPQWRNLSTEQTNIQPDPAFVEPLAVLRTAVTPTGNGTALSYTWQEDDRPADSFMVFLHFADFQNTQARQFDVYLNGNRLGSGDNPYSPQYLASSTVSNSGWYNNAIDGVYNITLVAAAAVSVLPPMLNAIEIYTLLAFDTPTTFPDDFNAIMAIKFEYGVKKNWMGDPCFPTIYSWEGLECSNTSGNATRIISLDLSNSNLHGVLSTNFTLLTALENLDLSNNNLSGSIPDSLPTLASLRVLNLSGNHLSGNFLCTNYTGSLIFRYDSNISMCNKTASPSKKKVDVLVTSVVVPVLVVAAFIAYYFIQRGKKKPDDEDDTVNIQLENGPRISKGQGNHLQDTESRRFTYMELEKFTDNFKRLIGQGGFGLVYYGRLEDGTMVAVKMRSESSSHGLDEFLAEVQSLLKVHHRNIVCLVGYCWEKNHLALVYEYMSQGNLYDHLRGKNAAVETMNWGTRVRIVLEAAQGLDYLHNGCSPPILHRDVKSRNILLGQNLQAKIADLGLSRTYLTDSQTHISVTAAGTAGYMDPEYYLTGRLTESSDVYGFGVVLLEVATGEPPLVPGHGHIVQRVRQRISTGDISSIADSRLGSAYDVNSMWKVVDTAMACTAEAGGGRPTMTEVVAQLKDTLALEDAREHDRSIPMRRALQGDNASPMSSFGPSAR